MGRQKVITIHVAHVPYSEDFLGQRAQTAGYHNSVLLSHRLAKVSVAYTIWVACYSEFARGRIALA